VNKDFHTGAARNLPSGALLYLSNFSWGRIEALAPMEVGCGEGVPLSIEVGTWRRSLPLPRNFFLVFDLKMATFEGFSLSKSSKSTYGIGPFSLRFLMLCQSWTLGGGVIAPECPLGLRLWTIYGGHQYINDNIRKQKHRKTKPLSLCL